MNRSLRQKSVLPDMHNDMSKETKEEVMIRLRRRYATAGPKHKGKLLNQAVELLGYHRKAAIRAMRATPLPPTPGRLNLVLGRPVSVGALLPGALLALLYVGLACLLFVAVHRYAVRTGLVGRYSAETVS